MDWKILLSMAGVAIVFSGIGALVYQIIQKNRMGAQIISAEEAARQLREEAQKEAESLRKAAEL